MIKFYKFYSDAGHGWVAVKRQDRHIKSNIKL